MIRHVVRLTGCCSMLTWAMTGEMHALPADLIGSGGAEPPAGAYQLRAAQIGGISGEAWHVAGGADGAGFPGQTRGTPADPVVSVVPTSTPVFPLRIDEGGSSVLVAVTLGAVPTRDVVIPVTNPDPAEVSISVSQLVFTVFDWNAPHLILITGLDDVVVDGAKAASITLGPITGASQYAGMTLAPITVVNEDNDGGGGIRAAPTVALVPTTTLTVGKLGSGTIVCDQAAVGDSDSATFSGGGLIALFQAADAGDVLEFFASGPIAVSGSNILHHGTAIATWSGGTGGVPLAAVFTSHAATPAAAQDLLRAIRYRSVASVAPAGARALTVQVTDETGKTSLPASRNIAVSDQLPALAFATGSIRILAGARFDGVLVASDPDGEPCQVRITSAPGQGSIQLDPATGAFSYTASISSEGSDRFTAIAESGGLTSAPLTVPISITGASTVRRVWIVSAAPVEATIGEELTWRVRAAPQGFTGPLALRWQVAGAPPGLLVQPDIDGAVIRWTPPTGASPFTAFTILVDDATSGSAASQRVILLCHPRPRGGS
ncbi:hypothetical protein LBMAG53_06890 [Planctomycetota bacterium]|nr:hypothetical protein LBMAG53_06890 [Planctomycetota bacterium]